MDMTAHHVIICNTSPAIVTSPYEWKILEWDGKPWVYNNKIDLVFRSVVWFWFKGYLTTYFSDNFFLEYDSVKSHMLR